MANELYEMTVRVFYRKLGRIKYISHLDLVRCVSRCLKRSGLPVWHTLGFNPHIYVTFALPLALGYESECESMDFRLVQALPLQQVVDRLNQVFPQGLEAYHAAPVVQKPEAIAWAEYEITQEYGITTIINTHDMNSVMEIGEKIVYIHGGRKWWEGTKEDILHADNRELNDFVFASAMAKRAKRVAE